MIHSRHGFLGQLLRYTLRFHSWRECQFGRDVHPVLGDHVRYGTRGREDALARPLLQRRGRETSLITRRTVAIAIIIPHVARRTSGATEIHIFKTCLGPSGSATSFFATGYMGAGTRIRNLMARFDLPENGSIRPLVIYPRWEWPQMGLAQSSSR